MDRVPSALVWVDTGASPRTKSVRRRLRGWISLVVAAFLTVAGSVAPATAMEESTIVQLVNESRWADGKAGLLRNSALDQVALAWAERLAAAGTLSHNPDYSAQIPSGWTRAGENVASGYGSASSMHTGWMNSSGHRANILGDYTDIGVAFINSGGSTWGVQVFANYPGHQGPAAPPPAAQEAPAPAPVPVVPAPAEPEPPTVEETPEETPEEMTPVATATPPATAAAVPVPTITPTPSPSPSPSTPTPIPTPTSDSAPWTVPVLAAAIVALVLAAAGSAWLVLTKRRKRPAGEWPNGSGRRSLEW